MNDDTLNFLGKKMNEAGFDISVIETLKELKLKDEERIMVTYKPEFANNAAVAIHFKKSESRDSWYPTHYDMHLTKSGFTEPIKQTFYFNPGQDTVTVKEAYNLLEGRAAYRSLSAKDGERYNAWVQLDFKNTETNGNYKTRQFTDNYGFRLEKILEGKPIKELLDGSTRDIVKNSLQRGNREAITFLSNGKEIKGFVEASPQYKSLNFYGEGGKRLYANEMEKLIPSSTLDKRLSYSPKADAGPGEEDKPARKKRKGQSL